MAKKSANCKYMTPTGRASFLHVLKVTENLNGIDEYSLDLLIPKSDVKKLAGMKKKYEKLCREVWGSARIAERPFTFKDDGKTDKAIWKDGDARWKNADKDRRETYEAYKGHVYTKLYIYAERGKPLVLDRDGDEIIDGSEIQSGDYVRCHIGMSTYRSKKYGKQFSLKLLGVQKMRDGDPLGGDAISKEEVQAAFMDAEEDDYEYGDAGVEMDDDDDDDMDI